LTERICICGTQVPFARGGAEMLVESLRDELRRRGHEVDVVTLPFHWPDRVALFQSCLAWRLVDLRESGGRRIDRVIATRFPSYLVKHPNKVVWLVHQLRQAYDLLGTSYSDFSPGERPEDAAALEMLRAMDRRTLGEARAVYTISGNTRDRLERYNRVGAEVLYPPPPLGEVYQPAPPGDYVLTVGRLDPMKRIDLLVRAMRQTKSGVRCRIAGTGPQHDELAAEIARAGLGDRVELLGWVEEERLPALYAGALAVYYAPYDEDYGYVTVEGFRAAKPVVTCSDAGGVLEFVEDGRNGFVCPPQSPVEIAARLDLLFADRARAQEMGEAGRRRVQDITWDRVVSRLLA
jgi:glycosyltransferase involved in cell wall biosynthesis